MSERSSAKLSIAEFERLARDKLPLVGHYGMRVELIEAGRVVMRMPCADDALRPGGTVNGPAMVALADVAMYALVMSLIGPVEGAMTTSLNVNFLRRPPAAELVAEATILKLGKRLAVGEVTIIAAGETEPCAHVTATYSIPPR